MSIWIDDKTKQMFVYKVLNSKEKTKPQFYPISIYKHRWLYLTQYNL